MTMEHALKPDFRIYKHDTTSDWDEHFQACAGTIFDVFLFNANRRVGRGDMTPSYEMHYLGPTWTNHIEDDREREAILAVVDAEQVQYFPCAEVTLEDCESIGTSDESWCRFLRDAKGDAEQAEKDCREKWAEYCCGNGWVY